MKRKGIILGVLILAAVACIACWWLTRPQVCFDDCPPSVMVDGARYYCFSEEAQAVPGEDEITGYIRSYVDISGMPAENDQSNFPACLEQPYAWVEGQLLLYYSGQWNVCRPVDES